VTDTEVLVPVPLCSPQTPYGLYWDPPLSLQCEASD